LFTWTIPVGKVVGNTSLFSPMWVNIKKYEPTTNPKVKIQNHDFQNNIKHQMTTHKITCSLPIL